MVPPFQYTALDPTRREFRLLRPNQDPPSIEQTATSPSNVVVSDLKLDFRIEIASLNDNPRYTALSYVWGTSPPEKEVTIDDAPFLITESLFTALSHLQCKDIATSLWIDSISINQHDQREKASQVAEMGSIFSQAQNVIVWFGTGTEKSDVIADVVHNFPKLVETRLSSSPCQDVDDYLEALGSLQTDEQLDELIHDSMSTPGQLTIMKPTDFHIQFFTFIDTIPWWRRVWIIQEFVLARKCHFQVGNKRMEYDSFAFVMLCSNLLLNDALMKLMYSQHASAYLNPGELPQGRPNVDLSNMIISHRTLHHSERDFFYILCKTYCRPLYRFPDNYRSAASVHHDYIYGLAGLARDSFNSLGLPFDYSKSWQQVFTETAFALIKDGSTDLLALCQNEYYTPGVQQEVPSWVPTWHKKICLPNPWFLNLVNGTIFGNSLFSASSSTNVQCSLGHIGVQPYLRIVGVHIGTVKWVGFWHPRSLSGISKRSALTERKLLYAYLAGDIKHACSLSRHLARDLYPQSVLDEAAWRLPVHDHEIHDVGEEVTRASTATKARFERIQYMSWAINETLGANHVSQTLYRLPLIRRLYAWIRVYTHRVKSSYFTEVYIHYDRHPILRWINWAVRVPFLISQSRDPILELGVPAAEDDLWHYNLSSMEMGLPIRPFVTDNGYIGMGPGPMVEGDAVVIFHGSNVPHVLRPRGPGQDGYRLIGETFVLGAMDGELMGGKRKTVDIDLF